MFRVVACNCSVGWTGEAEASGSFMTVIMCMRSFQVLLCFPLFPLQGDTWVILSSSRLPSRRVVSICLDCLSSSHILLSEAAVSGCLYKSPSIFILVFCFSKSCSQDLIIYISKGQQSYIPETTYKITQIFLYTFISTDHVHKIFSRLYLSYECSITVVFVGGSCNKDFDGCADSPCTVGTNCTDLSPEDEQVYGMAFNSSQCPKGYEENNGICIGMYQIYLDLKLSYVIILYSYI